MKRCCTRKENAVLTFYAMKRLSVVESMAVGRIRRACAALVCLWTLTLGVSAEAQNSAVHVSQLVHKAWRLREGDLPGAPNAIVQTTDGYIWIGTDNGLYRFDGIRTNSSTQWLQTISSGYSRCWQAEMEVSGWEPAQAFTISSKERSTRCWR